MSRDKYTPTIGVECHVQLKTKTKLFAAVNNDAREAEPNTTVSPICFGLPGVLPVLNVEAVKLAIRAGHALNAQIAKYSVFDRKHYFYPDLPLGYQITQFHHPIVGTGAIDVHINGDVVKVGITRAHLEADAGKLTHEQTSPVSLVDLNRVGTPLIEIVSEPDIHSSEVAKAYAQELFNLMRYADVTDGDLYHGNMRFDVNVSVAPKKSKELGTRSEVKNLNSFKSVERSVEYEIDRQIELLEKGETVTQETRGWDDAKQKTYSQRSKEDAHDYRYFPDPDLPPVLLTEEEIEEQRKLLPSMPNARRKQFSQLGLDVSQTETLVLRRHLGDVLLESIDEDVELSKRIANILTGAIAAELASREGREDDHLLDSTRMLTLAKMWDNGDLNSNAVDKIAVTMLSQKETPEEIAEKMNLVQVSDLDELKDIVGRVLKDNSSAVEDVKRGETKAIGFLVGQVMKESDGKANPQIVQKLIKELIA